VTKSATPPPRLVVVKVGGSLFDHPRLGSGLRAYLEGLDAEYVLVVAGGGPFTDAIRELDRVHGLGEEIAHRYALRACELSQRFLGRLLGSMASTNCPTWWRFSRRVLLLNLRYFLERYERDIRPVPHTWELTSDSIAAYAAAFGRARLILLKSVDVPAGTPWDEAAARGWVDAHFPTVVAEHGLAVELVNFRRRLDEGGY
jgi:aspartokinase-like uncharacterized kinase